MSLNSLLQAALGPQAQVLSELLRSIAFYTKDAQGSSPVVADLPAATIRALRSQILSYVAGNTQIISNLNQFALNNGSYTDAFKAAVAALQQLGNQSQKGNVGSANPNGLGSNLNALTTADSAHPANLFFIDPASYYELFSAIPVGSLQIPPAVSAQIVAERQRVQAFTRTDFINMRDQIQALAVSFSNLVGAGDATYNRTFNIVPPTPLRMATDDDYQIIGALNDVVLNVNSLAAYGRTVVAPNPMDYVAGFAAQYGIPFEPSQSKFAVPYPYRNTLEQVAAQYLGDPDRWLEIATLNGLQSPYVDETGFSLALLTNGSGNEITIGTSDNLYVGQFIFLSSTTTQRTQRHITNIRELNASTFVVTLDGDSDLSRFTTIGGAQLQAFLPNTVNSSMTIYIPSDNPPAEQNLNTLQAPGIDLNSNYLAVGGQDLLLNNGDLAITQDGDCPIAVGLTNIVQKVKLALTTPQGSLIHHPEYGIGITPGTSIADLSANDLLKAVQTMFVGDPTFNGVKAVAINLNGPAAQIGFSVSIAGNSQLVSLTLDVQ
jgi:hypothetical protein